MMMLGYLSIMILFVSCIVQDCAAFRYERASTSFQKVYAKGISRLHMGSNEYEELVTNVKGNLKKGSVVVIKYGGHAMESESLKKLFCEDIAELCRNDIIPVIVHGGGPQIAKMLKKLNVESQFIDGLRVTDEATMEIAQMVLCGSINKDIASSISQNVGVVGAVGLSGLDAGLVKAKQRDPKLGLVGKFVALLILVVLK